MRHTLVGKQVNICSKHNKHQQTKGGGFVIFRFGKNVKVFEKITVKSVPAIRIGNKYLYVRTMGKETDK